MKKTSRKLFAAVASLGLAVAATVGSTYAWFSMNDTVSANGMTVKAQAESTLLISTGSTTVSNGRLDNSGAIKAATDSAVKELKPTSTVDGSNWYHAEAAEADKSTAKTGTYKAVVKEGQNVDYTSYVAEHTFYLQTFDASKPIAAEYTATNPAKDIVLNSITVTVSDADDTLSPCMRVLVVQGSNKVFTAPTLAGTDNPTSSGAAGDNTGKGVSSISNGDASLSSLTFATKSGKDGDKVSFSANNKLVDSVKYNEVYTVKIYIYFDGEDAECNTDNIPAADDLANYAVTCEFKLADHA